MSDSIVEISNNFERNCITPVSAFSAVIISTFICYIKQILIRLTDLIKCIVDIVKSFLSIRELTDSQYQFVA